MYGYREIMNYYKTVKVFVLTAPNKQERFLFYTREYYGRPQYMVGRQIHLNGKWKNTQGLSSDRLSLTGIGGHIHTTKQKGNLRYLEFVDKGYTKTVTTLADV